jgi:hypothetical protein
MKGPKSKIMERGEPIHPSMEALTKCIGGRKKEK